MKVLVLGVNGMIGSTTFRVLSESAELDVFGSMRSESSRRFFSDDSNGKIFTNIDVLNQDLLVWLFANVKPDVVINCVGATKHKTGGNDPIFAIPLNAMLPHRLAELCSVANARLIHISTDCVFSGKLGNYSEAMAPDAIDVYGQSKALGEVLTGNSLILRTSTIGHELESKYGLLDWFLAQTGECKGFKRAIFSGLPTVEFARVIRDIVIPKSDLKGLYNVAGYAINKFDLLQLISRIYGLDINIHLDEDFVIDRSLNATRFNIATGYTPPQWDNLIETMYNFQ
jgi:dTDP-4-dehydrorhamnose reductase